MNGMGLKYNFYNIMNNLWKIIRLKTLKFIGGEDLQHQSQLMKAVAN